MAGRIRTRGRAAVSARPAARVTVKGTPSGRAYAGIVVSDVAQASFDLLTEPVVAPGDDLAYDLPLEEDFDQPDDQAEPESAAEASGIEAWVDDYDAQTENTSSDLFDPAPTKSRRPRLAFVVLPNRSVVPILLEIGSPISFRARNAVTQKAKRLKLIGREIIREYEKELSQIALGEPITIIGRLVQTDVADAAEGMTKFQLSKEKREFAELPDGRVIPLSDFFRSARGSVNRTTEEQRRLAEQLRLLCRYPSESPDALARMFVQMAQDTRIPHRPPWSCEECDVSRPCAACELKLGRRYSKSFLRLRAELRVIALRKEVERDHQIRLLFAKKGLSGDTLLIKNLVSAVAEYVSARSRE